MLPRIAEIHDSTYSHVYRTRRHPISWNVNMAKKLSAEGRWSHLSKKQTAETSWNWTKQNVITSSIYTISWMTAKSFRLDEFLPHDIIDTHLRHESLFTGSAAWRLATYFQRSRSWRKERQNSNRKEPRKTEFTCGNSTTGSHVTPPPRYRDHKVVPALRRSYLGISDDNNSLDLINGRSHRSPAITWHTWQKEFDMKPNKIETRNTE